MDSIQKLVWKQIILQIGVLPHCKLIREISLSINIVWLGGCTAKANTKEGISCNANLPSDTNANSNNLGVNKLQSLDGYLNIRRNLIMEHGSLGQFFIRA